MSSVDTVSRLPDPQPSGQTTVVPTSAPEVIPHWVAKVARGGNVNSTLLAILAAIAVVMGHDALGSSNLKALLESQDRRIGDLEDVQSQLLELHQHEADLAAWRDESMEALAKKMGVELRPRPTRSNLPVIRPRRR